MTELELCKVDSLAMNHPVFEGMECAFQATFARASTVVDTADERADAVTIAPTTMKMLWPSSQVLRWMNSLFPILALWDNKNWSPITKVKI